MITFIHLGALGRLGNQMFQYAALRGLGLARGYETKIPNIGERMWHGQKCLLQNFNIEVEYVEEEELKDQSLGWIGEIIRARKEANEIDKDQLKNQTDNMKKNLAIYYSLNQNKCYKK